MTHVLGLAIESMVAVLLLLTILYCVRLNNQIRLLKADEQSLRGTIAELVTATEIAERAINDLKLTATRTDQTLVQHLAQGEVLTAELERQIEAADILMRKLAGIVAVSRPLSKPETAQTAGSDTGGMVAAASAFAERARMRLAGGSKAA